MYGFLFVPLHLAYKVIKVFQNVKRRSNEGEESGTKT